MFDVAKAINELAKEPLNSVESAIESIELLISQLEIGKQFELHSLLSEDALSMIYSFRERLRIPQEIKEHLVWWYFKGLVLKSGECIDSILFDEIINEFISSKSLGIESIIIQAIKSDILTESQLEKAKAVFSSKAFEKECLAHIVRKKIFTGVMLDSKDVNKLLASRAYSVLELALDKKLVTLEGLECITDPGEGTPDKKIKFNLFQKAQLNRTLS